MNQRELELQELFLQNEKLTLNKLKKAYKDSLNEINVRIAMLENRSDANMQNVIYQVEYQKALKTQVEAVLDNLQNKEFDTVSEYLTISYEDGFIGTMYNLQGQNIPLVFPIDQEQVVDAIKNETKLSEDLYAAFDMTELKKQIQGEISRGIASSSSTKEIAMNISFFAKVKQNNAMRIARTEGHRIQCRASMNACEKAKDKGADVVKQWDATLDKNTRKSHQAVDGEIKELDEKFSNGLMYPGDPNGGASEVVNCRCSLNQRARWALNREVTKWSPDAPVNVDEDGTTQYYKIPGKDYKEFKENYYNATNRIKN